MLNCQLSFSWCPSCAGFCVLVDLVNCHFLPFLCRFPCWSRELPLVLLVQVFVSLLAWWTATCPLASTWLSLPHSTSQSLPWQVFCFSFPTQSYIGKHKIIVLDVKRHKYKDLFICTKKCIRKYLLRGILLKMYYLFYSSFNATLFLQFQVWLTRRICLSTPTWLITAKHMA